MLKYLAEIYTWIFSTISILNLCLKPLGQCSPGPPPVQKNPPPVTGRESCFFFFFFFFFGRFYIDSMYCIQTSVFVFFFFFFWSPRQDKPPPKVSCTHVDWPHHLLEISCGEPCFGHVVLNMIFIRHVW